MQLKFRIEVESEKGVFSASAPGAMPENKAQEESFVLEGDTLEDIQKKACLMVSLVAATAAHNDKIPEMFAANQEFIKLNNPFFGIK